MLIMKNRDSNYWLRDHVSHNKFYFDINWTDNSTPNIFMMSCSPKLH